MRQARLLATVAAAAAALGTLLPAAAAADRPLVMWAPSAQAAVIQAQLASGFRGIPVSVISVPDVRSALETVQADDAPDLIWASNAWTGDLVARSLIEPLPLSETLRARFPENVLDGFRYGFDFYGLPVQFESMALVTNAELVPEPVESFAELERRALSLMAQDRVRLPLAVGQGGVPEALYVAPLFTGLGGYLFGRNPAGSLDPYNVGIGSPALLESTPEIDRWNRIGLLSSDVSVTQAQAAFLSGQAPFWITGTTSARLLSAAAFDSRVEPVPQIVEGIAPAPYLDIEGVMVTSYATAHGSLDDALALARRHFATAGAQAQLARAGRMAPAHEAAGRSALVARFTEAARSGIAVPNIPQARAAWRALVQAWSSSTSGVDAVPARAAFSAAHRLVLQAIG